MKETEKIAIYKSQPKTGSKAFAARAFTGAVRAASSSP